MPFTIQGTPVVVNNVAAFIGTVALNGTTPVYGVLVFEQGTTTLKRATGFVGNASLVMSNATAVDANSFVFQVGAKPGIQPLYLLSRSVFGEYTVVELTNALYQATTAAVVKGR